VVELERVRAEIPNGASLHVRRGATLERDAVVVDIVKQISVLAQTAPVADAVRPADVNRLMDRSRSICFARMDRHGDVVVVDELERLHVMLRGVVVLGPREIEAYDAAVLVRDRELCHLDGRLRGDVANAAEDHVGDDPVIFLCVPKPRQDSLDHGREAKPASRVEHRRVAHLDVPDVLGGRVLCELVRDLKERVLGLEHLESRVEGLEVFDERAGVLTAMKRLSQGFGCGGG